MPSFSARDEADVLVLTLNDPGELRDIRGNTFRDALYEAVGQRALPRVAFDLGVADYLSSSGVAILVGLKRRAEALHGKLVLVRVHPDVLTILKIMKLSQYFDFADDVDHAVATLRPSPTV